ncbi:glycosyl hydrolase family 92-domain-containing protein [Pyronema omphalodes]|nr:glycosyl hydrolase family 92-domain-containing protein [Pyronema omphalodes]
MGVEGGGNMFPGVTLPFGVVKLGIDLQPPRGAGDPYSGYHAEGNITGFSMMHESGTGGAPKYGVVSQLPIVGDIENPLLNYAKPRSAPDEAKLGWYKAHLADDVTVELAASRHSGMIRHSFPADSRPKNVLVDVSHFLPSFRGMGIEQHYVEGAIKVHDDGSYTGSGVYNGGWNRGINWRIYFCGKFSSKPTFKTFSGTDEHVDTFDDEQEVSGSKRLGALFTFTPPGTDSGQLRKRSPWSVKRQESRFTVESKIGISWMSEEKACSFIDDEIPSGMNPFEQLVEIARSTWDREVLSKVETAETNRAVLEVLYSSLYGMFLLPSDRTGENPNWDSTEPYYDDIFTLWDIFRSHTPLFHILQPKRYTDFIRSLVDTWRFDGWLPDGRSSNFNGRIQGGTNADNVLADARLKGVRGVNWNDAYAAMVNNAENVPPNNNDPQAKDSSTKEGRGAIASWKAHGYITSNYSRSVSRASEYASNDFCVGQMAKSLGKMDDYEKYTNRSKFWRNHWDPRMSVYGFNGFLSPINKDGNFPATPQDPLSCNGCYWADPYYQAFPFEYSFGAHHDMKTMITYMGGDNKFIARLEKLFEPNANPGGDPKFGKTIFNPGNEPSFASPYLFNFVPGNQWRSVKTVRHIAKSYYNSGKTGLPGNSDAGAMQSWLLWAYFGLYPITGTTTFLIGAPMIPQFKIKLGEGRAFEVTARGGLDGYVQSLKVNGKDWNKGWVEWKDVFENGGKMEFVMGPEKTKWDTGDRPLWDLV